MKIFLCHSIPIVPGDEALASILNSESLGLCNDHAKMDI